MRQDILERQHSLQEKRVKQRRLKKRLEQTSHRLTAMKQERDRLHRQLTKEQQDVVKLGKFSFAKMISEWKGTWDEKMLKEIEEAAEAELKFNEAEKHVIDLEREADQLRKQLKDPSYTHIHEDWEDFLKEKEGWIRLNDSVSNQTLQKIADDRVRVYSMLREIDEALEAGKKAEHALAGAMKKLDSAEGMSMWDTFLGGGLFVSALKYSEINSSDDLVHQAQRALRHYETELMDVQDAATESFQINKNDIFTFTDVFFDNIFSDWMVHTRITDAKKKLHAVMQDVRRIQDQLERKRAASKEEIRRLDQQQEDIIMS
ncbi:hypothetical protein SporoP37_08835 [Sporosarcina sp. P37]|uniref:hypothetical protein n=1 Tax=unclassified Sporosarcina TaxID=2647733 RepID=UPI000A17A601|nr:MULTISPECIES: hypothetical protein [unclassified Sporosarcina]ARK24758.1 hypothetical protein SporoP37_08835 [Sporosarcina sp. P37]PID19916.1 hypothetical protein CSV62_01370 [Sporosarcina sp. P35]